MHPRHGKGNKWTTPQSDQEDNTASCRHSTTVYDRIISVTETVHVSRRVRTTSASTVFSTQIPRAGCDLRASSPSTTATATTTTAISMCSQHVLPSKIVTARMRELGPLPRRTENSKDGVSANISVVENSNKNQSENESENQNEIHDKNGTSQNSLQMWVLPTPPESNEHLLDCFLDVYFIIIPSNPFNVAKLDELLSTFRYINDVDPEGEIKGLEYKKISAPSHRGFTAGYFLQFHTERLLQELSKPDNKQMVSITDCALGHDGSSWQCTG